MTGGFQNSIRKKWPKLAMLAAVALLLFGSAYWWSHERSQQPEETDAAAETSPRKAPLPDTDLGRRVDQMLNEGGYQRDLPEAPKLDDKQNSTPMPAWLGELIIYSLVALGLFALAVMIWIVVTGSTNSSARARRVAKPTKRTGPDMGVMSHALAQPASLDDAELAAKAGNFGEAVRLLLATALISLAKQELVRLRPWMTGREIVRDAQLATRSADALAFLVATVEAYAFAGHVITEQTYQACFEQFQMLAKNSKGSA